MLDNLPYHLRAPINFLYITGWRKSEALSLRWKDVDFKAGMIRLEVGTTKNREGRIFPFHPHKGLRRILEDQWALTTELQRRQGRIIPWVFFHADGRPIKDFRSSWKKACKAAKIEGRIVHDFRRTAIRNFTRSGIGEQIGMKLAGHKTNSVYRRYNIVVESDLQDAVELLDKKSGSSADSYQIVTNDQVHGKAKPVSD